MRSAVGRGGCWRAPSSARSAASATFFRAPRWVGENGHRPRPSSRSAAETVTAAAPPSSGPRAGPSRGAGASRVEGAGGDLPWGTGAGTGAGRGPRPGPDAGAFLGAGMGDAAGALGVESASDGDANHFQNFTSLQLAEH